MLVNLSDVLTSEGKTEEVTVPLELESFNSKLGDFAVTDKTPIAFTFTNIGMGKAKMEGSADVSFEAKCDRCLTEVPVSLKLSFERVLISPDVVTEDEEEADSRQIMEGYQLDTEVLMYQEILANWPMKILCKEDCKGICPVCGQNRNIRECGCDTFVPDPRMAVIGDIFNANKEV